LLGRVLKNKHPAVSLGVKKYLDRILKPGKVKGRDGNDEDELS